MNIVDSIKEYFIGAYAEAKKVTWPTKQQTINYSLLVIALSVGLAVFFSVLDYFLSGAITKLIAR